MRARLADGNVIAVYVMLGDIVAAHADDDRDRLLTLLKNSGVAEAGVIDARRAASSTASLTEELFEIVPEEALQELLAERFRENLFRFLQAESSTQYEEMESVFVDNIQVGHESRPLVAELDALVKATARLRCPPSLVLCPGGGTVKDAAPRRLLALCNPRLPLSDLLQRSPFEAGRTLALTMEMLERGVLVPVSPRDNEGQTDKTAPRPTPAAKVAVTSGRPDPLSRDPYRRAVTRVDEPREAVANALASAVSAAVAKVGRQRPGGEAEPPRAPEVASALDPVSSPIPKPASRPASIPVGSPSPPDPTEVAPPPPTHRPPPPPEPDDELAAFQDYDYDRQGGEFMTSVEHLDRVEVVSLDEVPSPRRGAAPAPPPVDSGPITIEMEDAENATTSELASAVSLNFAGPKLAEDDARRKVLVVSEVLMQLVVGLDAAKGKGVGQSRAQLVIEGTPGAYSALFKGVEVDASGHISVDLVMKNLRKRPASEHRRLLNRGMQDVIERALSVASEELDDAELERVLEAVAGYQQRLGV